MSSVRVSETRKHGEKMSPGCSAGQLLTGRNVQNNRRIIRVPEDALESFVLLRPLGGRRDGHKKELRHYTRANGTEMFSMCVFLGSNVGHIFKLFINH